MSKKVKLVMNQQQVNQEQWSETNHRKGEQNECSNFYLGSPLRGRYENLEGKNTGHFVGHAETRWS